MDSFDGIKTLFLIPTKEIEIKIILIRHGETRWNHLRRIQGGSTDTPLSATGKAQVNNLGKALKSEKIDAIYSSPLRRALDTANAIAKYHKLPVQIVPQLRELEVGELEGLNVEDLTNDFSHFLVHWNKGEGSEKLPGGESLADLQQRSWTIIQDIAARHKGTVIVVCHYFVIITIICSVLGLPPSGIKRFRVGVGSMTVLDFENGIPRLKSLGDVCHLK